MSDAPADQSIAHAMLESQMAGGDELALADRYRDIFKVNLI